MDNRALKEISELKQVKVVPRKAFDSVTIRLLKSGWASFPTPITPERIVKS
jgi:hypothetical protein